MPTIGTTSPIYVQRDLSDISYVKPGQNYFWIKIAGAQAAYRGNIWTKAKKLLVATKVAVNVPGLENKPIVAIQHYREIKKKNREKLGLSPSLVNIVPAVMSHISISIDFILDKENNLVKLMGLINDKSFLSAVSLAPAAVPVAKAVGGISEKLIQSFFSPEERQPILQFTGDFMLNEDLRDGYYVILGTRDKDCPLPDFSGTDKQSLTIKDNQLYIDNKEVQDLSYVILDVRAFPVRTRTQNDGAIWLGKLIEAESQAEGLSIDPFVDDKKRKNTWEQCSELIQEARLLLVNDPSYLPNEAKKIVLKSLTTCKEHIFGVDDSTKTISRGAAPIERAQLEFDKFGFSKEDNILNLLNEYSWQERATQDILRQYDE